MTPEDLDIAALAAQERVGPQARVRAYDSEERIARRPRTAEADGWMAEAGTMS